MVLNHVWQEKYLWFLFFYFLLFFFILEGKSESALFRVEAYFHVQIIYNSDTLNSTESHWKARVVKPLETTPCGCYKYCFDSNCITYLSILVFLVFFLISVSILASFSTVLGLFCCCFWDSGDRCKLVYLLIEGSSFFY